VTPLYQVVIDDIKAQIARGLLKPGDKIGSTQELCAKYEVSRTVIAHALTILKAEGVVEGAQGRGVFITQQS